MKTRGRRNGNARNRGIYLCHFYGELWPSPLQFSTFAPFAVLATVKLRALWSLSTEGV